MAKRFAFHLETLLELRQRREEEQQRVVAQRVRELERLRQRREQIERQFGREADEVRSERSSGVLNIQHIARHRHWLTHLQRSLLAVEGEMRTLEARLAQERAVLVELSRERKALEKLKERRALRYKQEQNRREQREQDETAVVRHRRAALTARGATR